MDGNSKIEKIYEPSGELADQAKDHLSFYSDGKGWNDVKSLTDQYLNNVVNFLNDIESQIKGELEASGLVILEQQKPVPSMNYFYPERTIRWIWEYLESEAKAKTISFNLSVAKSDKGFTVLYNGIKFAESIDEKPCKHFIDNIYCIIGKPKNKETAGKLAKEQERIDALTEQFESTLKSIAEKFTVNKELVKGSCSALIHH